MKLCMRLVAGVIVLTSSLSTARAVVIFQDNFESYADQAAFDAVWTVLPSTAAGVTYENVKLSQEQSVSPTKSAMAPAQPTGATLLQRSYHDFPAQTLAAAGDKIVFSFDFYDSNSPAAAYREFAEIRSTGYAAATNQLLAIGLNNNQTESANGGAAYMGRILGYTASAAADPDGGPAESGSSSGSFFKLNDFGTGGRSLGWHNLKLEISTDDFLSTDYKFYVDNILAENVSNFGLASQIRSYERVVLGSALTNNNNAAYFDNVLVEYIPAPAPGGLGDFNSDGTVDAGDYATWRKGAEPDNANNALANDNGLGTPIGSAHYDLWRANFGNPPGAGSGLSGGAVPEPASVGLVVIGLGTFGLGRRGRVV
jgi:hypothetical protein